MALAAVAVAQDAGLAFRRGGRQRGLDLRLDHGQWIAFRPVVAVAVEPRAVVALRPVLTGSVLTGPVVPGTIITGPIITVPIITGPVVIAGTLGPRLVATGCVATRLVATGLVIALGVSGTLVAPGTVAPALAVTAAAVAAVLAAITVFIARPVIALLAVALLAITLLTVTGTVVALLRPRLVALAVALCVSGTLVAAATVLAGLPGLGGVAGLGGGRIGGFGLGLGAFVLEIDVEAGGEVVAAKNLAGRPGWLHGPKQAEIVFGVLQVVLTEHPVTGRRGVAGELLVLFEDVLGVAADLRALGTVGVERPVGVLGLGLAAAAAATASAAAIATALTLHTLEISHYLITVLLP